MNINTLVVGNLETNCYILEKNNSVLVIDAGAEFNKIKEVIGDKKVEGILITHHHFDHIEALDDLISFYNTKEYSFNNLKEGLNKVRDFNFEVIYNNGHSKDSISYYFKEDNVMFVGDFIFRRNIGRCDLSGGNFEEMLKSIEKIKKYSDDIKLYPGHGEITTLGYEKENNPYF